MLTTDDSSGSSHKRQIPLLFLLALNAGVGHILTDQISGLSVANAHIVKEEQVINHNIENPDQLDATDKQSEEQIEVLDEENKDNSISIYEVVSGDTISTIAEKFKVSVNTIRWANDLNSKDTIKIGDKLTILPITGFQYKVKSGDTISGIAKKYDADSKEILAFNGFDDAKELKAGMEIIIPDGEPVIEKSVNKSTGGSTKASTTKSSTQSTSSSTSTNSSSYTMPIPGSVLTQGIHGTNAVDFGAPVGTLVKASMGGEVILSRGNGAYNGGYGNYIVIKHSNGTQTLYAHLSKTEVVVGEKVSQGQTIAKSGNTGRSTGPHLHFEVRGSTNPFGKNKVGTRY